MREAIDGITKLELAKGNADLFWLLMGNGGGLTMNVEGGIGGKFRVVTGASKASAVEGRRGNTKLKFKFKNLKIEMTPAEALAIAAILTEGAERTLGKEL